MFQSWRAARRDEPAFSHLFTRVFYTLGQVSLLTRVDPVQAGEGRRDGESCRGSRLLAYSGNAAACFVRETTRFFRSHKSRVSLFHFRGGKSIRRHRNFRLLRFTPDAGRTDQTRRSLRPSFAGFSRILRDDVPALVAVYKAAVRLLSVGTVGFQCSRVS